MGESYYLISLAILSFAMEHFKHPEMYFIILVIINKNKRRRLTTPTPVQKCLLHSNFISIAETEVSLNILTIHLGLSSAENLSPLQMNNGI